ncbi:MAG: LLM class flavin-dependent oxidoreductase [Actinobacteria bacterium]|nr:LLM class flavin-dependent oxidoreductase [Actinomycetota bacterium]
MRIGLIMQLNGRMDDNGRASPTWDDIRAQVSTAEQVGFDSVVFEDGLFYPGKKEDSGLWEAVAISGAIAEATSTIEFGPSVFNGVYRSPAMLAKIAETIDEISGGRFIFGIGAGNTPDEDYQTFGFPTDFRYSRFEEAIEIIHSMLKSGRADHQGRFWSANNAEMVMRGPRAQGPPIVIAGGKPKMLRLAARFGDEWNWWAHGKDLIESVRPITEELDQACAEVGRAPATLRRSLDVYSVDPLGIGFDPEAHMVQIGGPTGEIADALLEFSEVGIGEVRCDLVHEGGLENKIQAVEEMAAVVDRLHDA